MTDSKALPSNSSDRLIWWYINQLSILSHTESKWEFLRVHFSYFKAVLTTALLSPPGSEYLKRYDDTNEDSERETLKTPYWVTDLI